MPGTKKYSTVSKEKNSGCLTGPREANGQLVSDGRKAQMMKKKKSTEACKEEGCLLPSFAHPSFYLLFLWVGGAGCKGGQ